MRQYFAIIVTIALVIVVLVAINAASYVEIEEAPDNEVTPDRSTYNARATGTRAFFDYLQESGHTVVRWREQPQQLLSAGTLRPNIFIITGPTPVEFERGEIESLLQWVRSGGRLVVVDRSPDQRLLPASQSWGVSTQLPEYPTAKTNPSNPDEMTKGVTMARAVQPTSLTLGVDSVLASRFASDIKIFAVEGKGAGSSRQGHATPEDENDEDYDLSAKSSGAKSQQDEPPPPAPKPTPVPPPPPRVGQRGTGTGTAHPSTTTAAAQASTAPVIHLVDSRGTLLVDYAYGAGRIIVLSDPFIIANNGINRVDNLQLALNLVGSTNNLIAFDEYHHGRAATRNQIIAYFAGTPVLAMLGQVSLIILVIIFTRGSRFARPLPLPYVDRRSKLEFVASMAELQQRSRAYDLAVENIYARTRRVLARYSGLDSNAPRALVAERVAARSKIPARELEELMRECEDAIAGEPLSARHALNLVARLREVERTLGLRMRSREIKQAKER